MRQPRARDKLPEGTQVVVISSDHEWLEPGMVGTIHWNHARAWNPTFRNDKVSVDLIAPRDKVRIVG